MRYLSTMSVHSDSGFAARQSGSALPQQERAADQNTTARAERVATLLCCDAAYLQHSAVCLVSLLANNPDLYFDIVIVSRPGEQLDQEKLRRSLARFSNHSLAFREFSPPAGVFLQLNPNAEYTLDTWNRLWVEEFFGEEIDRVLYLDGDIVVVGSIAELWRTDLNNDAIGVVEIPGAVPGVLRLGLRPEDGYFNAGMLLINLREWRRTRVLDTLIKYINEHPEQVSYAVDQEALNACLYGRKRRLDPKWNTVWTFFQQNEPVPMSREQLETVRRQARIIHYNNQPKPWSYFCVHPRKGDYQKYLKMTEWRDFVPLDRNLKNRLRKLVAAVVPVSAKQFVRSVHRRLAGAASAGR